MVYRRGVLAALRRHRESIGLWLLAIVFASACVLLGRWQLNRFQDKRDRAELVTRNYDAAPVPLAALLPTTDTAFERQWQWRPVTVTGTYDAAATTLVRNRPRRGGAGDAVFGYEVVVPLRLDDGTALLVDRGWLPNGSTGSTPGGAPDAVPLPPAGRVQVVARLKAPEPARDGDLPTGQAGSVAVAQLSGAVGYPVHQAYAVAASETPSAATPLAALDAPVVDGGEGVNASYAVQWVLFALLGLGFPVWVARRRRAALAQDTALTQDTARAQDAALAQDTAVAAATTGAADVRLEPARPRRRRIWDADDE